MNKNAIISIQTMDRLNANAIFGVGIEDDYIPPSEYSFYKDILKHRHQILLTRQAHIMCGRVNLDRITCFMLNYIKFYWMFRKDFWPEHLEYIKILEIKNQIEQICVGLTYTYDSDINSIHVHVGVYDY